MAQSLEYQRTLKLVVVECPGCGVEYGIPDHLNSQLLAKTITGRVYCPNGHSWHYTGKSHEQQLRDERARVLAIKDQLDAAERRAAAARGQVTKMQNRIANGVCPCCHRSFANVSRHMASKHSGYGQEDGQHGGLPGNRSDCLRGVRRGSRLDISGRAAAAGLGEPGGAGEGYLARSGTSGDPERVGGGMSERPSDEELGRMVRDTWTAWARALFDWGAVAALEITRGILASM